MVQTSVSKESGRIVLSGHFPSLAKEMIIIKNEDHFSFEVRADKTGQFKADITAGTGYVYLNDITIYLEPGMELFIDFRDRYLFEGKGSIENNIMQRLEAMLKDYMTNVMGPDAFIQSAEGYRSSAMRLLNDQPLSSYFLTTQGHKIDYVIRYYTNLQLMNQRLSQSDSRRLASMVWSDFDINNEDLYRFCPEYRKLLDVALIRYQFKIDGAKYLLSKNDHENKIAIVKGEITNKYIREALTYRFTKLLLRSNAPDMDRYFADYIDSSIDSLNAMDIKEIYDNLKKCAPGTMVPEFNFKDTKGDTLSLCSLRGRYVYIDIWATWCDHCIEELPDMEALVEKYENIVFLSISVDKKSNRDNWKDFVYKKNLKGLQVISSGGWASDFVRYFNVVSIPRFILVDPDGIIISGNALRPSDPGLYGLLDQCQL